MEALDDNTLLQPLLEGHVLSYDGTTDGVAAVRQDIGLPATGTDFSDASGLADALSWVSPIYFDRNVGYGDASGWGFGSGLGLVNWVDGVFFATYYTGGAIAPFVVGVPSGANPAGTQGTAVWSGKVVGRRVDPFAHLNGTARLTYDFADTDLDVVFSGLSTRPWTGESNAPVTAVPGMSWDDLAVSSGLFGDCSGSGDCIRGRFFDDRDGNSAESVGGVFRMGDFRGAFGAERQ